MADQTSQGVQAALQGLQNALSSCGTSNCNDQMAQVVSCVDGLLHQYAGVVQALENKSIAERALRNVVANKDAEAARLRGEVQRLRSSGQKPECSTSAAAEQQPDQCTPSEAEADAAGADPAARHAVLSTAVAAKDKPTAVVHQLESEVAACQSRIAALEAELAAAASEHGSRLAQQQKAFLAKLEQLRHVHKQQVAAVVHEAQKQLEQEKTSSKHQQDQLAHLKQQLSQEQTLTTALRQQLLQLQQQQQAQKQQQSKQGTSSCQAQATSADTPVPDTAEGAHQAPDAPANDQLTCPTVPAHNKAADRAAAAAEVAALRDMEAQLLRLSGTVKSYQGEREQLRQALMAGCNERQALQQLVLELRGKLQETRGDNSHDAPPQKPAAAAENLSRAYWGSLTN